MNSIIDEKLKDILEEVIEEARVVKIPVPDNIYKEIIVNGRPKKRLGCCRRKDGKFEIEVSRFVIEELGYKSFEVRQIIAHEVLHTCDGCYDHGIKWKKYASIMNYEYGYNIKRTTTLEEIGINNLNIDKEENIKYIIKCNECGREYPRQRFTCVMKKINAYRCSCGGKLTLIEKKK